METAILHNIIDKEAIIPMLKDLSAVMKDHPLFKRANLRKFDEWFMEGIEAKEFDTINNYPPFLWNKVSGIVDLASALKKAQAFKDHAVKNLDMDPQQVDKFIVDVIETTFEQRNKKYIKRLTETDSGIKNKTLEAMVIKYYLQKNR